MAKSGTLAEARPSKRAWCHPDLKKKLEHLGAYDAFVANCKKSASAWSPNERFFKTVNAFNWQNSDEGFQYWNDVHNAS